MIYFCIHDSSGNQVRAWQEGWPGDMFILVDIQDWKVFCRICQELSISVERDESCVFPEIRLEGE